MERKISKKIWGNRYLLARKMNHSSICNVYAAKDILLHRPVLIHLWPEKKESTILHPSSTSTVETEASPTGTEDANAEPSSAVTPTSPTDIVQDHVSVSTIYFESRAKIMAQWHHPHAAMVYGVGTTPLPYLVTEYVSGQTLWQWITSQKLTTGLAVSIIERCADCIQAAHAQGILHLGLSTKNIVITSRNDPKIIDFSLAIITRPFSPPGTPPNSHNGHSQVQTFPLPLSEPTQQRMIVPNPLSDITQQTTIAKNLLSEPTQPKIVVPNLLSDVTQQTTIAKNLLSEPTQVKMVAPNLLSDLTQQTTIAKNLLSEPTQVKMVAPNPLSDVTQQATIAKNLLSEPTQQQMVSKNLLAELPQQVIASQPQPLVADERPRLAAPIPNADYLAPELIPNCNGFTPQERLAVNHWCRSNHVHVGKESDVYALGAMLYHAITGCLPFATWKMQLQLTEPIPVRQLDPAIPKELEAICQKCLNPFPQYRYANASELAQDLRNFQTNRPIQARSLGLLTKTQRWFSRHPTFTMSLLLLIITNFLTLGLFSFPQWWQLYQARQQSRLYENEIQEWEQRIQERKTQWMEYEQCRDALLQKMLVLQKSLQETKDKLKLLKNNWYAAEKKLQSLKTEILRMKSQIERILQQHGEDITGEKRFQKLMQNNSRLQLIAISQAKQEQAEYLQEQEKLLQQIEADKKRIADQSPWKTEADYMNQYTSNFKPLSQINAAAEEKKSAQGSLTASYKPTQYTQQAWRFEITYTNTGNATLTNIQLSIQWDSLLECKFAERSPVLDKQEAIWQITPMEPGQSQSFALHLLANQVGNSSLIARISNAENANHTETYFVQILKFEATLSMSCPTVGYLGDPLDVEAVIYNPMTIPLTNITLAATWPDQWQLLQSTGNPQLQGKTASWQIAQLDPGERQLVRLRGTSEQPDALTTLQIKAINSQKLLLQTSETIEWKKYKEVTLEVNAPTLSIYDTNNKVATLVYYVKIQNVSEKTFAVELQGRLNATIVDVQRTDQLTIVPWEQNTNDKNFKIRGNAPLQPNESYEYQITAVSYELGDVIFQIQAMTSGQTLASDTCTTPVVGVSVCILYINAAVSSPYAKFLLDLRNKGAVDFKSLYLEAVFPYQFKPSSARIFISDGNFYQSCQDNILKVSLDTAILAGDSLTGSITVPFSGTGTTNVEFRLSSTTNSFAPVKKVVTITLP